MSFNHGLVGVDLVASPAKMILYSAVIGIALGLYLLPAIFYSRRLSEQFFSIGPLTNEHLLAFQARGDQK